ncbi:ADP/ATP translocase 4 [Platysternon megacephalum]|uniref:ADP/ATP translocase 4 n=1 Tax=Platysternon megacephalum TaxID=55544 RepID=A0A4D9F060_9SAUR|nr:ADP/ATP translocase 4 [Platysternon megacephalum]
MFKTVPEFLRGTLLYSLISCTATIVLCMGYANTPMCKPSGWHKIFPVQLTACLYWVWGKKARTKLTFYLKLMVSISLTCPAVSLVIVTDHFSIESSYAMEITQPA